jgi:hypothetical protein
VGVAAERVKASSVQVDWLGHFVKSVVQVPPGEGQQYCWPPQDSTLPARLQMLSSGVPSDSGGVQFFRIPSGAGHCSVQVPAAPGLLSGAVGATACCLS